MEVGSELWMVALQVCVQLKFTPLPLSSVVGFVRSFFLSFLSFALSLLYFRFHFHFHFHFRVRRRRSVILHRWPAACEPRLACDCRSVARDAADTAADWRPLSCLNSLCAYQPASRSVGRPARLAVYVYASARIISGPCKLAGQLDRSAVAAAAKANRVARN